ncbi:MAG TPA: hypothetical protein VNY84_06865, partial [Acidimicrobiales bacterium]|nr:hypothetical protein [Acidimicrobiales bacterium]
DVYSVVHAGRTVGAHIRSALVVRDQECCRPGCGERDRLEIHHFNVDYHEVLETRLSNIGRLCRADHHEVTHGRAKLTGGPGHWEWEQLSHGAAADRPPDSRPPPVPNPPADVPLSPGAAFMERLRQSHLPAAQPALALD